MYVRCPSCEEIHHYGFSGDYTARHRRLSRCANYCNYEIQFPFNEGDTSYEIDKQRALFVAGGADPTEYFLEQESKQLPAFAQDMRSRHKWTEATETIHYDEKVSGIAGGYSIKRLVLVRSAMIQGKVEYVRQYLDDSAESDIFLYDIEAWDIHRPSNDDNADNSCHASERGMKRLTKKRTRVRTGVFGLV